MNGGCYNVLLIKSICDPASLADIERTETSRLIDRMVDRGLIAKEQSPNDRRFSLVTLRPAGQDRLSACAAGVTAARAELFEGLSQDEIGTLLATLK
ncbi:MarR family winged helix-turn-helix transcriptional regulator [Ruegeria denitrificans]|uniref:MarR family winged helix-turn-helix transcriptional regulator n=1 Tax=Ruegeria denitrificans TaxID=1715692 RepID=UPI00071E27E8|nr:MarR family transcriptional regulator [Ruegeria denitrificans]